MVNVLSALSNSAILLAILASAASGSRPFQIPPNSAIPQKVYKPPTASEMMKDLRIPPHWPQYQPPAAVVTPAAPIVANVAYIRASTTGEAIELDTLGNGILVPFNTTGTNLQVFVHGQMGKATVVNCTIDGPASITATFSGGPDEDHLTSDPLHRQSTVPSSGNTFLIAVPADVPSISATNWFAVNLLPPSSQGASSAILYGCSVFFPS
ncbi:MAG TPA: hypothetical protein VHX63_05430 [Acidobacteriaceae bacterium]|jgi:hypothetical protein|nr:hypothetical protein [Acidobacteriaceae bacterium]